MGNFLLLDFTSWKFILKDLECVLKYGYVVPDDAAFSYQLVIGDEVLTGVLLSHGSLSGDLLPLDCSETRVGALQSRH
jgi:hypothetical protein